MIKVYVTAMKKGIFKLKTGSLYYSFPPSIVIIIYTTTFCVNA